MSHCRLVTLEDAPQLAWLLRASREFLAPWEPQREASYFTEAGQRVSIGASLADHDRGRGLPCVMTDDDGSVVGRVNLSTIVRGAFQSASLGYWIAEHAGGRGIATAAVRDIVAIGFTEFGLHRVQADTLEDNFRSRRVLARNGFTEIGRAPRYLKIAGVWQDFILHQVVAGDEQGQCA